MTNKLPLADLRVIELGHSVAAPYAGLLLAELGAEVIKVERPEAGDDCRAWGPPFVGDMSVMFSALNRHKKSVEVDLKTEKGRADVRAFALGSDIFIQNLRPGHAETMGLGYDELRKENPRLIYASISAFGDTGPLAAKPGYDPLAQAFGGIMSVTGEEGRPPIRVGTSIMDMGSGMWLVIGILVALRERDKTGEGSCVGTSLYETALAWMSYHLPTYASTGKLPRKQGSGIASLVPYQLFETADGQVMIAAGNDNLFRKLGHALGHGEWADDPRFRTNPERVQHRDLLCGLIVDVLKEKPTATWLSLLDAAGIPCAPVQTADQVLAHPQTTALDILRQGDDGLPYVGLPLRLNSTRPARNESAPALGAHNKVVKASS